MLVRILHWFGVHHTYYILLIFNNRGLLNSTFVVEVTLSKHYYMYVCMYVCIVMCNNNLRLKSPFTRSTDHYSLLKHRNIDFGGGGGGGGGDSYLKSDF